MLKKILLASTLLAPITASAATVDFGFWSQMNGGGIQFITETGDTGPVRYTTGEMYLGNNWGGVFNWVSNPAAGGNGFYEFAVNDVFSSTADTARFYATFHNVSTPFNQLSIPSFFQTTSIQNGSPPTTGIVGEFFICPIGGPGVFCDNYQGLGSNGLLVMAEGYTAPRTDLLTLSAMAPGTLYDIGLVIHIGSGISQNITPIGDFASAVGVQPFPISPIIPPAPVPGPIVGTGLPGLLGLFGMWWYRRRRATLSLRS